MASIENITYKGDVYDISDAKALHQDATGSWMPDFSKLKVLATYEFDISSTSWWCKICERNNVTDITDLADEVLAFRITTTGTNIFSIADCVARMQPIAGATYGAPRVVVNHQTKSVSAATTGLRYLRAIHPKAVGTAYKYEFSIMPYNTTVRHIKVEVFKAPDTWTFSSTATASSFNSTYHTSTDISLYDRIGVIASGTIYTTASYASYTAYKNSWDPLFNSQGNFLNAGAAIAASQFIFFGKDNKVYPTTSTSVEIDPAWPIVYCTSDVSSGAAVAYSYIRSWGYFTPVASILKDGTLVADGTVYMRCTYTDGKLYSANTMTQTLTAGNTYIKLGKMYSATTVSVNTYNSEFFTLDTDGHLKALNGYLLNADKAGAVSKAGTTAAGSHGVLLDNNLITDVLSTTTSPRVNAGLTFTPSTGILNATGFSGSGAGLTNIPLSGIQGADELLPTKTLHVYHDLDLDTYEFTDSLTVQEIKDILDDAADGAINLQISMVDVDTSRLLKYYQSGNMFIAKYLIFEDTPAIDMTTYQNHSLQSYFAIVWSAGSDTFQFAPIPGDDLATLSQQLMQLLAAKEDLSNKVTSIDSSSDNDQYPSAKAVYDYTHDAVDSGCVLTGYSNTGATSYLKVVTITNPTYTIKDGVTLHVYFNTLHTGSASRPRLSIDNVGYDIVYFGSNGSKQSAYAQINPIMMYRREATFFFRTLSGTLQAILLPDYPHFLRSPLYTSYSRLSSANTLPETSGCHLKLYTAVSGSMTTANGLPTPNGETNRSSFLIHFNYDTNNIYCAQLALTVGSSTEQGGMAYRRQNGTANSWHPWKTIADEDNIGTLTDVEHCYTAALTPAGDGTIVFPIDGTKYRITQITLTNYDLNATAGFGMSRMFIANNGGTGGYMLGAIDYFSLASTSTDITMTIQSISSSGMQNSTNLHVQVRYVKI